MQEIHDSRKDLALPRIRWMLTCVWLQPLEIFVDDETKLTLHGLQQHYVKLEEVGKNRKLNELLDTLEFNQVCPARGQTCRRGSRVFGLGRHFCEVRRAGDRVGQAPRFVQLPVDQYSLWACPGRAVSSSAHPCCPHQVTHTFPVSTATRPSRPSKSVSSWRLISSVVVSMSSVSTSSSTMTPLRTQTATFTVLGETNLTLSCRRDPYQVYYSRAGRFGTKGLAITFVSSEADQQVMAAIQSRFEVAVPELPDHIDPASYSKHIDTFD